LFEGAAELSLQLFEVGKLSEDLETDELPEELEGCELSE
jgi:hypothetical protein